MKGAEPATKSAEAARKAGGAGGASWGLGPGERQHRGPGPGFAASWAAGRALTIDQAVAEALDQEGHPLSLPEDPT